MIGYVLILLGGASNIKWPSSCSRQCGDHQPTQCPWAKLETRIAIPVMVALNGWLCCWAHMHAHDARASPRILERDCNFALLL